MAKENKKRVKPRNHLAVIARLRSGAGLHKDKKKEASKKKCRQPVDYS